MTVRERRSQPVSADPTATGIDPLADGAEIEDPLRSGLDDVGTTRSDVACVVPWLADGYQAIEVFVDPAVRDRTVALCEAATAWSAAHRDLDGLTEAVMAFAAREGLSASVFRRPDGELSSATVALAFTAG